MKKYYPLYDFLINDKSGHIKLSFIEIEKVISDKLPKSALKYREWWANGGHIQANAWLEAGYKVDNVSSGCFVEFIKYKSIG